MSIKFLLTFLAIFANFVDFSFEKDTKIVNGENATISEAPYQVSLRFIDKDSKSFGSGHFCGGSLIDNKTVLTAAHCLYISNKLLKPTDLVVVMGHEKINEKSTNTLVKNVAKVIIHENYNSSNLVNDIGLLKLEGVVPDVHPTVRTIAYTNVSVAENTTCLITGWGVFEYGTNKIASVLQKAKVPILNESICKSAPEIGDYMVDGMLCAGYLNGTIDSCQGDSGGPLVCNDKLVGITSFGYKCAYINHPGIYTDVNYFKNWINQNSGSEKLFSLCILMILSVFVLNFV